MTDYRSDINNYKTNYNSLVDILNYYRDLNVLTYSITENKWDIYFNNMPTSHIGLSRFGAIPNTTFPRFFLHDNGQILNIKDMQMLLVYNLLTKYDIQNNPDKTFVLVTKLRKIESELRNTGTYIKDASYNNGVKNTNKVKIVKTFFFNKNNEKNYIKILINAFTIPLEDQDIQECSKLFNDPISVELVSRGIYSNIIEGAIDGVGYSADETSITSIYPIKANIPERLRQHYTSKYLIPEAPVSLPLSSCKSDADEELGGTVVFFDVDAEDGPFGPETLMSGEVYATDTVYDKRVLLNRTISYSGLDVKHIEEGDVIHPGDAVIWDMEGNVLSRYELRYETATVSDIEIINNTLYIHLDIVDEIRVARIIGETGIKGVIHPVKDLGTMKVHNGDGRTALLNVDLLIGANAMKSGSNGIRLAWQYLKSVMNPGVHYGRTEEELNETTKDLKKCIWIYKGKEYKAYVGYITFGVTELAKDYKTKDITMSSETIKYLYNLPNEKYGELAGLLQDNYSRDNAHSVEYMFDLLDMSTPANSLVWDIEDDSFKDVLSNIDSFFMNNVVSNVETIAPTSNINDGVTLKIGETYINFPDGKFIQSILSEYNKAYLIPDVVKSFVKILYLLNRYSYSNTKILSAIETYVSDLGKLLYRKKGMLADYSSPKIPGGHLKQIVSSDIPEDTVVIVDSNLEEKILEFKENNNLSDIYDIGVRNPVLWRAQVSLSKVWTYGEYKQYLAEEGIAEFLCMDSVDGVVIRNPMDMMKDQSDVDGDLFPVTTALNVEIQKLMNDIYDEELNDTLNGRDRLLDYELDWIHKYAVGEADSSSIQDVENKPFKYHTIERKVLANYMSDAAIAKKQVGISTVALWSFFMASEFLTYNDKSVKKETIDKIVFYYSAIIQDTVIRGIKHVDGGSGGFAPFSPYSFDPTQSSIILRDEYGANNYETKIFRKIIQLSKFKSLKLLSRLSNGMDTGLLNKYINSLDKIEDEFAECSSNLKTLGLNIDVINRLNKGLHIDNIKEYLT